MESTTTTTVALDLVDYLLTPTFPLFDHEYVEEKKLLKKTIRSLVFVHTVFAKHILAKQYEISLLFPIKITNKDGWFDDYDKITHSKTTTTHTTLGGQRHGKKIRWVESERNGAIINTIVTIKKYDRGILLSKICEGYKEHETRFLAEIPDRCLFVNVYLGEDEPSYIMVDRKTPSLKKKLWYVEIARNDFHAYRRLKDIKYELECDAVRDLLNGMLGMLRFHPLSINIYDLKKPLKEIVKINE